MKKLLLSLCLLWNSAWASESAQVGVQLWSVKDELKQDFTGTLSALSQMGFAGVEFAGEFGQYQEDAVGLRALLDSLNLKTSGAHVSWEAISANDIAHTAEFYHTLGAQYLIIGWDERGWDSKQINALIHDLKEAQARVNKAGFAFGYHNHDGEFKDYSDSTFWDHIAQSSNNDFVLQLDVGWTIYAGKDAGAYISKYPNRTLSTHFKVKPSATARNSLPFIGEDGTDWQELIDTAARHGGTQWIIVEQEDYPKGMSPLEAVARSKHGLDNILNSAP